MEQNNLSADQNNLWAKLDARASKMPPSVQDLWEKLDQRLDFSKTRPKAISSVEIAKQRLRGEEYFILHNTEIDTYIQLDRKGLFVWNLMDGKNSLTDICLAYLLEFGSSPINELNRLLSELNRNSFLQKKTPNLYGLVLNRFGSTRLTTLFTRLWRKVSEFQLVFNVDGYFEWIYSHGGWLFFTFPVKVIYLVLSLVGVVLFIWQLVEGDYPVVQTAGSYGLGILTLYLINIVIILLHEHAHGIACKSFGRKVLSGGIMIYWGQPVFFINTTDMWLASKKGRIIVSWAGPYSGMLVASVCVIVITLIPSSAAPVLFQVAFIGMVQALVNMNPLLEWDGYYILTNYLEIPGLRSKSFDFLKGPIWKKLSGKKTFTREEKIFTVFGTTAAIWSILAVLLAVQMWRYYLFDMLKILFTNNWIGAKILLVIIGFILAVPLIGSTGLKVWQGLRDVWKTIIKRGNT